VCDSRVGILTSGGLSEVSHFDGSFFLLGLAGEIFFFPGVFGYLDDVLCVGWLGVFCLLISVVG